jgi:hypothetical protein
MCCCADPVPPRHVDQHDREFLRTENIDRHPGALDDFANGMDETPIDYAFLQVDHNQRGIGIKGGKRHRVLLASGFSPRRQMGGGEQV